MTSNAPPRFCVPCKQTERYPLATADMDKDEAPFSVPEMPTAAAWLGIIGGAIARVLVCALWTLWN